MPDVGERLAAIVAKDHVMPLMPRIPILIAGDVKVQKAITIQIAPGGPAANLHWSRIEDAPDIREDIVAVVAQQYALGVHVQVEVTVVIVVAPDPRPFKRAIDLGERTLVVPPQVVAENIDPTVVVVVAPGHLGATESVHTNVVGNLFEFGAVGRGDAKDQHNCRQGDSTRQEWLLYHVSWTFLYSKCNTNSQTTTHLRVSLPVTFDHYN